MSNSIGVIKFEDGLLMYTSYQNTADVMHNVLISTPQAWALIHYEASGCKCGKDEVVEIATSYGMGYSWQGRACRHCKRLTDGFDPFEKEMVDGFPEWWPFEEE